MTVAGFEPGPEHLAIGGGSGNFPVALAGSGSHPRTATPPTGAGMLNMSHPGLAVTPPPSKNRGGVVAAAVGVGLTVVTAGAVGLYLLLRQPADGTVDPAAPGDTPASADTGDTKPPEPSPKSLDEVPAPTPSTEPAPAPAPEKTDKKEEPEPVAKTPPASPRPRPTRRQPEPPAPTAPPPPAPTGRQVKTTL
jgi:hypothetical protein